MEIAELTFLPPETDLESKAVLKQAAIAHRYLAELKGVSKTIPNQAILITTLGLQESKESSEIENIITTQDEMFRAQLDSVAQSLPGAREVSNYARVLREGFRLVKNDGLLANRHILTIHENLMGNDAGFRSQSGTALKHVNTGKTVYVPPQDEAVIQDLMKNLEDYINDDMLSDVDPLIKMAVIHHQFESIHPFYDGNGRIGRIINILYLVLKGLLDLPVLYLSRYLIHNKASYYELLQSVRENHEWEQWTLYMLRAVATTSWQTIQTVREIHDLMMDYKHQIRKQFKFYSQDLLNNLFQHPYTKISFLEKELQISRLTATKYLDELAAGGFLEKRKFGRDNYYINVPLNALLANLPED